MPTGVFSSNISLGGISVQSNVVRTEAGQIGQEVTLPAGKAGALTTRTSDTVGEATMATGHGITTGALVDVYWDGGVRYGVTVGTVNGQAVPLTDSGAGDVLPADETPIVIGLVTVIDTDFDGDKAAMLAALTTKRGHVDFRTAAASAHAAELQANEAYQWASDTGVTNPLASDDITAVRMSNGDSTGTAVGKLGVIYDSLS
jgi:hypothetical protein